MDKGKDLAEKAKHSELYQHPMDKSKELASDAMDKVQEVAPSAMKMGAQVVQKTKETA
jgi:hypothetical protein